MTGSGVDVALATNMISVGLDITRLGLISMVQGQPKTAGRIHPGNQPGRARSGTDRPGLVLSGAERPLKPRDRLHYERPFGSSMKASIGRLRQPASLPGLRVLLIERWPPWSFRSRVTSFPT